MSLFQNKGRSDLCWVVEVEGKSEYDRRWGSPISMEKPREVKKPWAWACKGGQKDQRGGARDEKEETVNKGDDRWRYGVGR